MVTSFLSSWKEDFSLPAFVGRNICNSSSGIREIHEKSHAIRHVPRFVMRGQNHIYMEIRQLTATEVQAILVLVHCLLYRRAIQMCKQQAYHAE